MGFDIFKQDGRTSISCRNYTNHRTRTGASHGKCYAIERSVSNGNVQWGMIDRILAMF